MKGVILVFVLLLSLDFSLAALSNSQSNFIVSGCDLPGGGGVQGGACSRDGRYFCQSSGSGGILLDTITDDKGCSFGNSSVSSGSEQCCPAGYECKIGSSSTKPLCYLRSENCNTPTNNNKVTCESSSCFWIDGGNGQGVCVDRPSDYGCNVYKNQAACVKDYWNLGSVGMGTEVCDGRFFTNGSLGAIIPKSSCRCKWAGSCVLSYEAKADIYAAATVSSSPDRFECQKNYSDSSPCISGKQSVSWTASIKGKLGLFIGMSDSAFNSSYRNNAECDLGSKDRNCGYETVKLPGVSIFSIMLSLAIISIFYFYSYKRNDL